MADDGVDGVVASLDEDIGFGCEDEFHGGGLIEDDDGIDTREGCENAAAFALADDWTRRAFEAGDGGVTVNGDDELVAGATCLLKDGDVADVKEVEAAVGEGDLVAIGAPDLDAINEFFARDEFVFSVEGDLGSEGGKEFVALDGNGANLADNDAGGDVGEFDGSLRSEARGEGEG